MRVYLTVAGLGAVAAVALAPPPVAAQSCPALPQIAHCSATAPAEGASFTGTVLQVVNGSTLCVAFGPTPDQWLRVRLADADAAVSRGQMMAAAFAQSINCRVVRHEGDEVVATCAANGLSVVKTAAALMAPGPAQGETLAKL